MSTKRNSCMGTFTWVIGVVALLLYSSPGMAGPVINDDFQTGTGSWDLSGGFARVDIGGGQYVLADSTGTTAWTSHSTAITARMQIDLDMQLTASVVPSGFTIYFHLATPGDAFAKRSYYLQYVDDYNTDADGWSLREKVEDYGAVNTLGYASRPVDTNPHHVRLTDDGTGYMKVYIDDMVVPAMQLIAPNYFGADGQYITIAAFAGTDGWVDNVVVYSDQAPEGVTDLAAGNPDWFKLDLTWTAPSDVPPGPVASYDLRYSTAPIDSGNWGSATPCTGEPTPDYPGASESVTVTGLSANTTYYFAMMAVDDGGLASGLSNVASATTGPPDGTAPSAISDLAVDDTRPNRVTLGWTAVGDDGGSGTANAYDLRYSTSPITGANWASATQVTGESTPQASGTVEAFTVAGLQAGTTYYFAMVAVDEAGNASALSNVVSTTTLAADTSAPAAVADLTILATHIQTVYLTWTAPADVGTAGVGSYDVRYSTAAITEGNWASATQVAGEPVPAAAGSTETLTVSGLTPETTYYFAIKSTDLAEPANTSALSNVPSGSTVPPVPPVVVVNPWITNDRVPDCRTVATMGATFVNTYTPDGMTSGGSDQEKAINVYNNMKRRFYHWGVEPPNYRDTVQNLNVFGWALCGTHGTLNTRVLWAAGYTNSRKVNIDNGGHTFHEAYYDGAYHAFDTMCSFYVLTRGATPHVASCAELDVDDSLIYDAAAEGRVPAGFLLCGDTPDYFVQGMDSWTNMEGPEASTYSMNMELAMGTSFERTWESWANQHPPTVTDPPYHHEAQNDWKDTFNFPYWEPYEVAINGKPTYRRWSNGTITLEPDFRSQGYLAAVQSSSNIATYNDDTLLPELHAAASRTAGEVVFKIDSAFYMTDAWIDAKYHRTSSADILRVYASDNGVNWTQVWEDPATGETSLQLNLRSIVFGLSTYYVKFELYADGAPTDVGVDDLLFTTVFEHNKGAMAYLDKGVNNITVTLDNPQDLGGSAAFKVTYNWKEYDGSDWTIARTAEHFVTSSPSTFTITVNGSKVPRTESIVMEVTAPPAPDGVAPDAVTDLVASNPDSTTIDLSWTATGDDGNTGQATTYDIRYSTGVITEANFASATAVQGVPTPLPAGNAQSMTVTGLTPSTTYYIAMKVLDEGNMVSGLSNVVNLTTAPPDVTAPAAITDLLASNASGLGVIELTWTAPGDNGSTGTATSYDVRYSTSVIDNGNFASATQVGGVSAPQAAGSAESVTVSGLTIGQTYYFAVKTTDESNNTSGLSNVASLLVQLGDVTLQDGADGYAGTADSYIEAGNVTANYGGLERMRVTGFADSDPANRQRGIVKFDVSAIPQSTTISTALLYVYSYDVAQVRGSTGAYGAYAVTTDWNEGAVSWNVPWTTAGGDFSASPDATASKQSVANVWYVFNVTSRVQQWVNNGGTDNFGWVIKCTDEDLHNQDVLYQSDTSAAQYRPKLFISDMPSDSVAPAAITDLAAATGANAGEVDLTWTAPGDDGNTGVASSYDVRYSTSPIDAGNWDSAAVVAGTPVPQPAGSAESFTVTGLPTGQMYYFAIKSSDEVLNESGLSNVASANAVLGLMVLQDGLSGYAGTDDAYMAAASPDVNFDAYERMRVTGYADSDPANRQRGLVKFDLTGIGAGTVITSAKLQLYSYDEAQVQGSAGYYGAYPVTTTWAASTATWNSPWSTAGGDVSATPDGTAAKQTGALVWYEFDVTSRVQAWINDSSSNHGWVVMCTDENQHNQDVFYQSDAADAAHRPKLIIQDSDQYVISVDTNPLCGGSVDGDGAYAAGQTCTLTASAYEGNTFVAWSGGSVDGSTNPTESFVVNDDETITAVFQTDAGYISVCDYATLAQAIQVDAVPGDVILVQPGTYRMPVGTARLSFYNSGTVSNPITIRGVMSGNQRPILESTPGEEINRGFFYIWDVDHDWVIENLEFRNLRGLDVLYSSNAASMYINGDNITVRNCYVHDNDNGFMGATTADNTLIENCEIYNNGTDLFLGYTHGMYMSNASLTVRGCYFHDGHGGMLFKSRTGHHVLEYNWLENDGSEAFVANAASGNANNALWRGNVFIKRSPAGGQRGILSVYDGLGSLDGTLTLINNTIISAQSNDIYIMHTAGSNCDVVLRNNVFAGPSDTLMSWNASTSLTGSYNVFPVDVQPDVPAGVTDSIFTDTPGFVDLANRDLHLLDTSACKDVGLANPQYKDENQQWVIGVPQYEPNKSLATLGRLNDGLLDIGALEYDPGVPFVAFSGASQTCDEACGYGLLSVTLSEAHDQVVSVDYAVTGGTATGGGVDFILAAGTLQFAIGETSQAITLDVIEDQLVEGNETVEVTLSNPSNAVLGATSVMTATILDNDSYPVVAFQAASSSDTEAVTSVAVTVNLDASYASTVSVDYAVTGGTAVDPDDFTLASGTLQFLSGSTSEDIVLSIVDDSLDESDETIQITLSSPVNATLGANTVHTYTIVDDDSSIGYLINDDFQVDAGNWQTANGFGRVDSGSGQYVYQNSGDYQSSFNTTALPAALEIDMDVQCTILGSPGTSFFGIYFHMSEVNPSMNVPGGYQLRYTDDYNTDQDGLQLRRKEGSYGTETLLVVAPVAVDTNLHHLRIVDDGTGLIEVYWDNMVTPVISYDDSATYQGAADQYLGVYANGTVRGWVDNVTVTAPGSGGPTNTAPTVDAGVDQAITLPTDTVNLDGTVSDDGLPNPPAAVTVTWSQVSGPGTVTFGDSGAVDTTATFSTDGTYVLELLADDGDLTASDTLTVTVDPASGGTVYIDDDFQVGTGNWDTTAGFSRVDLGGGQYVFQNSGDHKFSFNSTALPAEQQIDMDFQRTVIGSPGSSSFGFYFHLSEITYAMNVPGGYQLRYTDDYNTSQDGLQLWRKEGSYGAETLLVVAPIAIDTNLHHLRVVDDGTGMIEVYWDDMVTPVISYDDSATYQGAADQYLGLLAYGDVQGWVDNVTVTAPGGGGPTNTAPTVDAGVDQAITLPTDTVNLDGTVSDDGLPDPPAAVTVTWSTVSGPGTVTFADSNAVDTTATFSTDGTYVLELLADDGDLTASDTLTVTVSPEPLPVVAFDLASSSASESNTAVTLAVSLGVSYSQTVTVDYDVTGGTASGSGVDYTLASGTVQFDPGVTSQTIALTVNDDAIDELDETVEVTLSNASNATLGATAVHTYTIADDDAAAVVAFDLASSADSESVTAVTLAVSLDVVSGLTVTVDYAVTDGTATGGGVDYTLASGTVQFDPGVTSQTIALTIVDDTVGESDETIEVTLSNPGNGTLGAVTVHTYTVNDDDGLGTLLIDDDFQAGTGNWQTTNGFTQVDLGGGQYVMQDGGGNSYSFNTTPLPTALQIDLDFQRTAAGYYGEYFGVYFHMTETTNAINVPGGYQLRYVDDWGSADDGLQLRRKEGSWGTETLLTSTLVALDNNAHHIRVVDDGTGLITVYFDDMVNPVITYDDSANYQGAANQYLGIFGQSGVDGWFDNVVVYGQ